MQFIAKHIDEDVHSTMHNHTYNINDDQIYV